ncbi:MAG TPA: enoyl-CoA hydratase-related protein [Terriglobales bacterium]|nr:enoyl-CoA hydratase-related protein [Terriglobales bacterium]
MSSSHETILYEKAESIATITFNRPDVLNAFNEKMGREFFDALKNVGRDNEVRCVIVTGKGRTFSAGEDIQDLRGQYERGENPRLGERLLHKYNPMVREIRRMEKPVVAAVNGVAAGAGAGIAYSCDIRIASDTAKFIQAFIRVGLAPDSGTSFFLPRLVGFSKAIELALTGDELSAKDAERFGAVAKVVPNEQLMIAVQEYAKKLAGGPTRAIGLTKRALNKSVSSDLETVLEYESYLQEIAGATSDHIEAVRAFFEKRKPIFKGH